MRQNRRRGQRGSPGWAISKATLHDAGVQLAAALGSIDAAERAELTALRRFRDGVVALRDEMRMERTADHWAETIDALLVLHSPTPALRRRNLYSAPSSPTGDDT